MRILLAIISLSIGGCLCTPSTPKAVTLRLKNTSRDTLFVDTTAGDLGMRVQRSAGGGWVTFDETPRCACLACDMVCSGTSSCPEPTTRLVQRVPPGSSFDRQWAGVVQLQSTAGCGGFGGTMCLAPENAPYNETFNLHLCYALSATLTGASTDGGAVEGVLPSDVGCVDRTFHIDDGVAEVGPQRGADCVTTADCKGMGELCFSGACTASCPANTFPSEAESSVRIGIDDRGFFTVTQDGSKITYTGTGTVGSATYNTSSLRVFLTRQGSSGETLTGTIDLDVPRASYLGPLASGQKVQVRIIDNSPPSRPTSNAAFTRRDEQGSLLIAADSALGTPNLAAADLAPFTVTVSSALVGCRMTGCGKELFSKVSFSDGTKTVELEPGGDANLVNTGGTYRAVNVFGAEYTSSSPCEPKVIRPYILWRDKAPGG
jgi:hypothetical protein